MSVSRLHGLERQQIEELKDDVHRTLATLRARALSIQIEGAVDYAIGRPLDGNPYAIDWAAGWEAAASLFPPDRLRCQRRMTQERWPS